MKRSIFMFLLSAVSFFHALAASQTVDTEQLDTYGNVTRFVYDKHNRLVEVIYPPVLTPIDLNDTEVVQFCEKFSYDSRGNLIEHCDANGDITQATYDDLNNPLQIRYPDGTEEFYTYFPDGSPESHTNRSGVRREFRKDCYGILTELWMIDREGNAQRISLDEACEEASQTSSHPHSSVINACGMNQNGNSEDTSTINDLGQTVRQIRVSEDGATSTYTFNAMGRLETKAVVDFEGNILSKETFLYDGNGNCALWKRESSTSNSNVRNFFGPCGRIETSIENYGTPEESTSHYLYNEYGEPIWTDSSKESGDFEEQWGADNEENDCIEVHSSTLNQQDTSIPPLTEQSLRNGIKTFVDSIRQIPSIPSAIVNWFKMPNPSNPEQTEAVSWLRWTLNHLLHWTETSDTGVVGKGELGNHVRITYINGMWNNYQEVLGYLNHLSKIHGGANIHYVFRESNGLPKDVLKAGLIKAGYVSDHAKELVQIWKHMIDEMGGVDGGGTIIHYAHSLGAMDTYVAGGLLTHEERMMVKVYTFGSPQIIPSGFFGEATNYISRWDGVCLLGPYNFIKALLLKEPHVIYLRSSEGFPLQDHPISCDSYNRIMMGLSSGIVTHFGPLVADQESENN